MAKQLHLFQRFQPEHKACLFLTDDQGLCTKIEFCDEVGFTATPNRQTELSELSWDRSYSHFSVEYEGDLNDIIPKSNPAPEWKQWRSAVTMFTNVNKPKPPAEDPLERTTNKTSPAKIMLILAAITAPTVVFSAIFLIIYAVLRHNAVKNATPFILSNDPQPQQQAPQPINK